MLSELELLKLPGSRRAARSQKGRVVTPNLRLASDPRGQEHKNHTPAIAKPSQASPFLQMLLVHNQLGF